MNEQNILMEVEIALNKLDEAMSGLRHDPSWMRPQMLLTKERRLLYQEAIERLRRLVRK